MQCGILAVFQTYVYLGYPIRGKSARGTNPAGVSTANPVLGWIGESLRKNASATAYSFVSPVNKLTSSGRPRSHMLQAAVRCDCRSSLSCLLRFAVCRGKFNQQHSAPSAYCVPDNQYASLSYSVLAILMCRCSNRNEVSASGAALGTTLPSSNLKYLNSYTFSIMLSSGPQFVLYNTCPNIGKSMKAPLGGIIRACMFRLCTDTRPQRLSAHTNNVSRVYIYESDLRVIDTQDGTDYIGGC